MKAEPIIILHVEDDSAHAEIAKRCFDKSPVANRVYHVSDGQAALDYLFHQSRYADPKTSPRPDLILLDLRLPKVDGLEVIRRIKNEPGFYNLPVVILTTSGAESDIIKAYSYRASSYLVKPLDSYKFSDLLDTFGYYWLMWNKYPH